MMIRNKSIVITSGFTDSYVPIEKALQRIGGIGSGITQVAELPATGEEGKIYYNTTNKKYYVYNRNEGFKTLGGSNVLTDDIDPANLNNINSEDIDVNDIHYLSKFHTWWKFEGYQVERFEELSDTPIITTTIRPAALYTAVAYCPGEDVIEENAGIQTGVRTAAVPLNPSMYYNLTNIHSLIFNYDSDYFAYPFLALIPIRGKFTAGMDNVTIQLPDTILPADSNPSIQQNHVYEYRILDNAFTIIDVTNNSHLL